jgi:hypothetical protein
MTQLQPLHLVCLLGSPVLACVSKVTCTVSADVKFLNPDANNKYSGFKHHQRLTRFAHKACKAPIQIIRKVKNLDRVFKAFNTKCGNKVSLSCASSDKVERSAFAESYLGYYSCVQIALNEGSGT